MDDAFAAALAFMDEYAFADDALHALLPPHPPGDDDDASLLLQGLLSNEKEDDDDDDDASAIPFDAYDHAETRRRSNMRASEAASGDSRNADDGSTSKKKKKKAGHKSNPNKARDERHEEVIYLCKAVAELEARLRRLEQLQPWITANTAAAVESAAQSLRVEIRLDQRPMQRTDAYDEQVLAAPGRHYSNGPTAVPSAWETVAHRQRDHRAKAERENIRLKLVLENQLKITRSLEKILNRKASVRMSMRYGLRVDSEIEKTFSAHAERDCSSVPTAMASGPIDAEVFEELVAGLDTTYAELDAVFGKNGLAHNESSFSDAVMRSDSSGYSIRLEISANEVVPFEMHATGKATWHHLLHAKQRTPSRFYTYEFAKSAASETMDGTVLEDFALTLHAKNTSALLRVKQVLRRYVEEDRIVIVLRSVFYPMELGNEPLSGVIFRDTEYIVVKRSRSTAGDYSLLQTCYIYTPVMGNDHPKAGAITDFMLRATEANISASHEMIESALLSQTAASCAREGGLEMVDTSV